MNYEPSEKEKYIRKATKEYADRIRAMFPEAKVKASIINMDFLSMTEISEHIRSEYGERLPVRENYFGERYFSPQLKGDHYEIETISE